jgi:hypothetical protein
MSEENRKKRARVIGYDTSRYNQTDVVLKASMEAWRKEEAERRFKQKKLSDFKEEEE